MSEQSWKPLFRAPKSTVTKVLQSQAFISSRRQAGVIFDDAAAVRELGEVVESLDLASAPLSTIADRVSAAVSFLRFHADALDAAQEQRGSSSEAGVPQVGAGAASVTRERLIVAALHYLVTPVDLVPDFRPGGYIDDVLLLSWVFGAAAHELQPFLEEDLDS